MVLISNKLLPLGIKTTAFTAEAQVFVLRPVLASNQKPVGMRRVTAYSAIGWYCV